MADTAHIFFFAFVAPAFSAQPIFYFIFFVFIARCCFVYLCFIDNDSVVCVWGGEQGSCGIFVWSCVECAHFCVYFFQFESYVCIDYILPNRTQCVSYVTSQRRRRRWRWWSRAVRISCNMPQKVAVTCVFGNRRLGLLLFLAVSGVLIHTICDKWRFYMNEPTNILRAARIVR